MTDRNKKTSPRIIQRRRPRFDFGYVAPADAVNETLRVNGLAPEQVAERQRVVEQQQQMQQQQEQRKKQTRQAYRQRRMQQTPLAPPMSDEQVDQAIALEEYQRQNQKYFEQGSDRPKVDTDRLSDQYATVSNFYAALGSPNMMPYTDRQVRNNPQVAATQLQFGLNNPALTVLQIAAPTGGSTGVLAAGKTAATQAFRGAGNLAMRTGNAAVQGTKAATQAVVRNAPRIAGVTAVNAVPMAAVAADFPDDPQNGEQSGGSSAMPWIIGGAATLIGGSWAYNKLRNRGAQTAASLTQPKYFTWWERNPNAVAADAKFNGYVNKYNTALQAGDQAALDAMKTEFGKSPAATITQGKGKRATQVPNPEFLSNTDLGTMIQKRAYPTTEGSLIYTPRQNFWRGVRNTTRLGIYGGTAGWLGNTMFGGNSQTQQPPMLPTAEEYGQNYQAVDSTLNDNTAPTDTVVAIPRDSISPTSVNTFNWSDQQ